MLLGEVEPLDRVEIVQTPGARLIGRREELDQAVAQRQELRVAAMNLPGLSA